MDYDIFSMCFSCLAYFWKMNNFHSYHVHKREIILLMWYDKNDNNTTSKYADTS